VITRPPGFAQTSVLGTLPGANATVFTRIRVTGVLFASLGSREAGYFYTGVKSLAEESFKLFDVKYLASSFFIWILHRKCHGNEGSFAKNFE